VLGELANTEPLPMPPRPLHQRDVKQNIPAAITKGPDPGIAYIDGPDSKTPYFDGPRNYVKVPPNSGGPLFSSHNHNSAIVECPNGDLLATWFTTHSERGREMALAASRLPYGSKQWRPASPFWDAPDRNDPAHTLWRDGKLIYHFSSISTAATWGPLAIVMRTSNDNGATWSRPRVIIAEHGRRHQVIESVFRTREGYLVLPCDARPDGDGGTALHISRDNGQTWADAGGTIAGIHAAATQLSDGRLLAFGRGDSINNKMPMSISADMGRTWVRTASQFPTIGGGQRLVLLKLKQGPLLLVSFATSEPITITDAGGNKRPGKGLFATLSYDDGRTWSRIRLLTDDGPDRKAQTMNGREFTLGPGSAEPKGYLSVCQGANGLIHLTSSWNHYAFNLKWLETPPSTL
jgi:hypothetical protein